VWGVYASDARLLCGDRLCGGPLDIQAAGTSSSRPGFTFSLARTVVRIRVGLGARDPLRLHFVNARALSFRPKYRY